MVTRVRANVVQARAASIQVKQLERELDALPPTAAGAQRLDAIERVSALTARVPVAERGKGVRRASHCRAYSHDRPDRRGANRQSDRRLQLYASFAELTPETSPVRTQLASLSAEQRASYTQKMLARRSGCSLRNAARGATGSATRFRQAYRTASRHGVGPPIRIAVWRLRSDPLVQALRKDFVTYRTQQLDRYTRFARGSVKVARLRQMQALLARTLGLGRQCTSRGHAPDAIRRSQRVAAIGREQQNVQIAAPKQLAAQQQLRQASGRAEGRCRESRATTTVAATHGASSTADVKSKGVKLDAATDALADSVAARHGL